VRHNPDTHVGGGQAGGTRETQPRHTGGGGGQAQHTGVVVGGDRHSTQGWPLQACVGKVWVVGL
jgi:hypothetical protein